jgi:hypothetical protein
LSAITTAPDLDRERLAAAAPTGTPAAVLQSHDLARRAASRTTLEVRYSRSLLVEDRSASCLRVVPPSRRPRPEAQTYGVGGGPRIVTPQFDQRCPRALKVIVGRRSFRRNLQAGGRHTGAEQVLEPSRRRDRQESGGRSHHDKDMRSRSRQPCEPTRPVTERRVVPAKTASRRRPRRTGQLACPTTEEGVRLGSREAVLADMDHGSDIIPAGSCE